MPTERDSVIVRDVLSPSIRFPESNPYANSLSKRTSSGREKIAVGIDFAGLGPGSWPLKEGDEMEGEQTIWENHVAALANVLGLILEPDWKAAAAANLETIFKIAALVDGFELPDDIEPAPVFEA
jgi:hypothetical protein